MTTARKDVQTAIVLQGGGALGAYEYGVLRALYEQRPGFRPVAVAGVSIGAITAAVLGGARTDPIAALDALWRAKLTVTAPTGPLGLPAQVDRSLALLGNPGMYQLRAGLFTAPWLLTSFYDTAPLRQTLAELVEPARLNADDPRVIVGATNVGTGEMEFFDRERPGWMTTTTGDLWWIAEHLVGVRHRRLLSAALVRRLHRVDRRSLDAGLVGYREDGR